MIVAPFRYCPHCGLALAETPGHREFVCVECGFHYFHSVASAVAAFMVAAGRMLVTRRAIAPSAGTLDLPGGFVEPGETLEDALCRELEEELGVTSYANPSRYQFSVPNRYTSDNVTYATSDSFFRIDYDEPFDVLCRDDIDVATWQPIDVIDPADFGLYSSRTAVGRMLSMRRTRD